MLEFLRLEPGNIGGKIGIVAAKGLELPRVNPRGAIFAGLVDAQHRLAVGAPVAGAPAAHARRPRSVSSRISAAPPSDRIAFQPASVTPRKRNCTSSQRTSGACVISLKRSAVLPLF